MTAKILVADNNVTQKIVTMAFKSEAVEITGVASGPAAWERIQEIQPDVVLADINLKDLSGFDLSRKIKESGEFENVRVVLLSSDFEDLDQEKFKQSKADDYLSKPFKSRDLVAKVRGLLTLEPLPETAASEAAPPPVEATDEETEMTLPDEPETPPAADLETAEAEPISLSAGDLVEDPELDIGDAATSPPDSMDIPPVAETFPPILELRLDDLVIQDAGEEESFPEEEMPEDEVPEDEIPGDEIPQDESPGQEISEDTTTEDEAAPKTREMAPAESSLTEDPPAPASPESPASETADPPSFKAEAYLLTDDAQTAFDESLVPDPPGPAPAEIKSLAADPGSPVPSAKSAETPAEKRRSMEEEIAGPRRAPAPLEELEKTFRSLSGQSPARQSEPASPPPWPPREAGRTDPDLIRETLAFLSAKSGIQPPPPEPAPWPAARRDETGGVSFDGVMEAHALRLLETSLEQSLKQEIEGLSDSIIEAVRDVVKEVAPGIVRRTIQEEIENLRNMEEV
ncbi:MAG: response regulator [Nitrospinaceae bacterium]